MKTLAIIGAGDLGKQIAHYAISDNHYKSIVFFDDYTQQKKIDKYAVIGKTTDIEQSFKKNLFDELLIGIGYKHLESRKLFFEKFKSIIPFGKIIHSSSWIDKTAIIQDGSVIYPCCNIDANSIIGENTIVNIACTIAHDTTIGKHCFLSPRVALAGFTEIREQCILGINSTIIDNIKITNNVQLGGGTLVIKDINEPGLYVGNPAKFIRNAK